MTFGFPLAAVLPRQQHGSKAGGKFFVGRIRMANTRKPRIGKICANCGEEFYVPYFRRFQKYCSKKCFNNRGHVTTVCLNCGEEFAHPQYQPRKFCSRACANTSDAHEPATRTCPHCGQEFTTIDYNGRDPQTYCSNDCRLDSIRVADRACEQCGKMFTPKDGKHKGHKQKYCSPKCQNRAHRTRVTIECERCGKPIQVIQSRLGRTRYCSKHCQFRSMFSSAQEREMVDLLATILNEKPFRQHTFDWLRNDRTGRLLYIDAYFPITNLAVEYDGKQHRHFMPLYHKTKQQFADLKRRDRLKERLLAEHGVPLLRIQSTEPKTREHITARLQDRLA